jgi:hypothetical protein
MNASRYLTGLLFALTLFLGANAHAQSCTTLVQSQFDWVQRGGGYYVNVTGVSLLPGTTTTNAVASHFSGYLDGYVAQSWYYHPTTGVFTRIPARLTSPASSGRQAFNDRGYNSTSGGVTRWQNFSVFAQDNIQLELDDTGKMTVVLNSWSNTRVAITSPTCNGNVLTGYAGTRLYAFTFQQTWLG